jgi:hypothetical protein
MGYWIGIIGCWIISDGILSWTLYLNAVSYENNRKQTFLGDHWVRLVRIILGAILIWVGFVYG